MADIEILHRRPARPRVLPPLLFVHGAYMGAWCWDEHILPDLAARGLDCWAISLRGHGNSAGADRLEQVGLDDYVDDLARAASQVGGVPIVVGHSMGSIVVQHYARAHPVSGVVLMAGVPPLGLLSASLELSMRAPDLYAQFALIHSGQTRLIDFPRLRAAMFSSDMPDALAMKYFKRMGSESQRVLAELAWPHNCSVRLAAEVRIAVVAGQHDGLFSADGARASAMWHGTRAEMLPGLGHAMMLDPNWRVAADWLADWVGRSAEF